MEAANQLIVIGAGLLLGSILVSAGAARIGAPVLLAFLALGMLAGEDGPGGIVFNDYWLTYIVGMLALAVILFDGGLRTREASFRAGLWPALSLATLGVVISAAVVGVFASWLLGLHWMQGLLIGAIVGSTDAAAVFGLLHARGMQLKTRVASTLEIESGSNDPMAVFLTVALVELLQQGSPQLSWDVAAFFVRQMGIGALTGVAGGLALGGLINRLPLTAGLYPLLALAGGLFVFGATNWAGGSGFLAIYLAGIVMGNRRLASAQSILRVHDGFAWLGQIVMFLLLGLLATPSELVPIAPAGLAIALALMFVARPAAVGVSLIAYRAPWQEKLFISWVGLRGAVPIILALFPLLAQLEGAKLYLNIAFFVVLVSLIVQGWTLAPAARWLGLELPPLTSAAQRVELSTPGRLGYELVAFRVGAESPLAGQPWLSLPYPEGARLCGILRGEEMIDPDPKLQVRNDDLAYLLAPAGAYEPLARLFAGPPEEPVLSERRFYGVFSVSGEARLAELASIYGVSVPEDALELSAAEYLVKVYGRSPGVGDRIRLGPIELVVKRVDDGRVAELGLVIRAADRSGS